VCKVVIFDDTVMKKILKSAEIVQEWKHAVQMFKREKTLDVS